MCYPHFEQYARLTSSTVSSSHRVAVLSLYYLSGIEDNLSSLSDNPVVDDKQKRQYDDDDTLALMEVDLKLLSRMDTVDAESAKVAINHDCRLVTVIGRYF